MTVDVKCAECRGKMTTRRENVKYDASGLPGITLLGVEVSRCATCGEYEIAIPSIERLHEAIAREVIAKKGRLTPQEVRFLRKYLGFSSTDFARQMDVQPETVSRREKGAAIMSLMADRLLRTMVVLRQPVRDYTLEDLEAAATRAPRPLRIAFWTNKGGWKSEPLAGAG